MSHARSWRDACFIRFKNQLFHFDFPSIARGVTAVGVGSGALLGRFFVKKADDIVQPPHGDNRPRDLEESAPPSRKLLGFLSVLIQGRCAKANECGPDAENE
jgi:hypothetical protein